MLLFAKKSEVACSWRLSTEEIGAETVGSRVRPIRMLHLEKFLFIAAYFLKIKF